MDKIEKLKKQEAEIRNKINEIEDGEVERVQKPRLKKMVGQCFAYRNNCYSCPETKSDYWDVFRKIIDWVDTKERGFYFIVEEFSVDSNGSPKLNIENHVPYLNEAWWDVEIPFSGYEKITEKEYDLEKDKMLEEMRTQNKMRKILNKKF